MPCTIRFDEKTNEHLEQLTARQRTTVLDAIERQLLHQPTIETRNRKPMQADKSGFIAPWELRIGANLRVYYDVRDEPRKIVLVIAIGTKLRNRVRIGDVEFRSS